MNVSEKIQREHEVATHLSELKKKLELLLNMAAADDFLASCAREKADLTCDALSRRFKTALNDISQDWPKHADDKLVLAIIEHLNGLRHMMRPAMRSAMTPATPFFFAWFGIGITALLSKYVVPLNELPFAVGLVVALLPAVMILWVPAHYIGGIFVRRAFSRRLNEVFKTVDGMAQIPFRENR